MTTIQDVETFLGCVNGEDPIDAIRDLKTDLEAAIEVVGEWKKAFDEKVIEVGKLTTELRLCQEYLDLKDVRTGASNHDSND